MGPFQNWECAQKAQGGHFFPFRLESSSKAPGVTGTVLHLRQSQRLVGRGSQLSPLPVGGSLSSHPAAAHPCQMPLPAALRPHTAAKPPSRALAALPPGNYTLGANLLPLPGEAWGESKESEEKERQTWSETGAKLLLQRITGPSNPRRMSHLHSTW